MSLSGILGIATTHAATTATTGAAAGQHQSGFLSLLPMLILIGLVFYFLMVRPQQKRTKQHKALMDKLAVGDEIVTIGGMVGKLSKLRDGFIELTISNGITITLRKSAIESVLPKGTMEGE